MAMSSLIDTWLLLRDIEIGGERNRGLYILKSRGMNHSNQIREFILTEHGIELLDVYVGPEGVLTGSARLTQEAKNHEAQILRQQEIERKRSGLELKRAAAEANIVVLQSELKAEEAETLKIIEMEKAKTERFVQEQKKMAESRKADKFIKKTFKQPSKI
jgi:circadian clock protein KaiC